MSTIEDLVKNESVADVLTVLALNLDQPRIDKIYTSYRFETLETGELWNTYDKLFRDGILASEDKGCVIKGPNWKEPAFITEKKYSFE